MNSLQISTCTTAAMILLLISTYCLSGAFGASDFMNFVWERTAVSKCWGKTQGYAFVDPDQCMPPCADASYPKACSVGYGSAMPDCNRELPQACRDVVDKGMNGEPLQTVAPPKPPQVTGVMAGMTTAAGGAASTAPAGGAATPAPAGGAATSGPAGATSPQAATTAGAGQTGSTGAPGAATPAVGLPGASPSPGAATTKPGSSPAPAAYTGEGASGSTPAASSGAAGAATSAAATTLGPAGPGSSSAPAATTPSEGSGPSAISGATTPASGSTGGPGPQTKGPGGEVPLPATQYPPPPLVNPVGGPAGATPNPVKPVEATKYQALLDWPDEIDGPERERLKPLLAFANAQSNETKGKGTGELATATEKLNETSALGDKRRLVKLFQLGQRRHPGKQHEANTTQSAQSEETSRCQDQSSVCTRLGSKRHCDNWEVVLILCPKTCGLC